ncbi:MAG: ATP-binding protein [Verrucomicrobia bacterium]|jgi:PAS domain S-box-containing protein|nr:ATP-binding protein [Verrucomicrobiota bacterium]
MTKIERALALSGGLDLVKTESERTVPAKMPSSAPAVVLMSILVVLMLGGGAWVWWESSQILKYHEQLNNQVSTSDWQGEAKFLMQVAYWQLGATLVTGAGGGVLIAITVGTFRNRRQHLARQLGQCEQEWKTLVDKQRMQLAEKDEIEGQLRKQQEKLNAQIIELSRAKAALEDELSRRRQAEKSLAQQREELARSKDVLQLHVRARTQEVEKLQRRSELILNSAAEGICGFDLQGRVTFANPAAARVMGLSVPEMIGRPEQNLFPAFRIQAGPDAAKANGHQPVETVAPRPDRTTFAAEYIRSPIHENDHVVGEVLMFKDITERKQAAETLTRRVAELARSNAELEQFAFVASHDLQEPLRKIQAFGDRLKTKCDEARLESGRDYLERMQSAAARMQTLINDLLTFSRVISRTEPFEPVNLTAITREVLGDLEVRIERGNAQVEVGELPTIEGDAMQMRQLLQNLIGNALKFQPPGAQPVVRILGQVVVQPSGRGHKAFFTQKSADGTPTSDVGVGEEFCELTVQDNGIGFDEQYLDKIFAVFTRLHGRQEYEGTGIGLAVCRRITDRHGGTITARSKPGEGATFIVRLPLKQSPQPVLPK